VIGSVATSRRAHAFAQDLEEHELDKAMAADQAAGDGGSDAATSPGRDEGSHAGTCLESGATPEGEEAEAGAAPRRATRAAARARAQLSQLLSVVDELAALPSPGLSPEVKTAQRAQLIAAMETEFNSPAAETGQVPEQRGNREGRGAHRAPPLGALGKMRAKSRLTRGLAAGGLGVSVAASAFGGVAAASTHALPGDSLYGFKRGMEDLQLDLADDDSGRGRVHLDHASARLQEARSLMERARSGSALDHKSLGEVRKTLSGMRYDASEGHRLLSAAYKRDGSIAPMRSLSSFSRTHRAAWTHLRRQLPAQLADVGDEVNSVFDAIDSEVSPLQELFTRSRQGDEKDGKPGAGAETGSETPSHTSPPSGGAEGHGRGHEDGGDPSPSRRTHREGGLIGGGSLLHPSPQGPEGAPSAPDLGGGADSGESNRKIPTPDVTLPPIIPDVLQGLHGLPDEEN
jgi:hypothetical protein